ncbi:uncharacterized protein LOC116603597 isoform X2 [Nematostella vectensis]|uniref:uncharacterized protein LOC116603597 isoform X2 n=1 Tax=Nematostella vectensis TaxID=45351 RepID=UPI0020774C2C|nr:uncharacterized protein LOC116603597 isoform X2 [Nematostella vectensis]
MNAVTGVVGAFVQYIYTWLPKTPSQNAQSRTSLPRLVKGKNTRSHPDDQSSDSSDSDTFHRVAKGCSLPSRTSFTVRKAKRLAELKRRENAHEGTSDSSLLSYSELEVHGSGVEKQKKGDPKYRKAKRGTARRWVAPIQSFAQGMVPANSLVAVETYGMLPCVEHRPLRLDAFNEMPISGDSIKKQSKVRSKRRNKKSFLEAPRGKAKRPIDTVHNLSKTITVIRVTPAPHPGN